VRFATRLGVAALSLGFALGPALADQSTGSRPLFVRGRLLSIVRGTLTFSTGESLLVASGLVIPAGVNRGAEVRATVDRVIGKVTAVEPEPHGPLPSDIEAAAIPSQYIVTSAVAAPGPQAPQSSPSGAAALPALRPSETPPPEPSPSLPPAPLPLPGASSSPRPPVPPENDAIPPLYVRGQVLAISGGFFIFTTGDSLRVGSGLVIPAGVTTGSYVRVTIDQLARTIDAIELEPHAVVTGEIDAANIPRQYVVVSAKSAPLPAATGQSASSGNSLLTLTIVVHVPGNTPTSDDVYLATERSNYSPAEVRMDRIDGSTFSTSISVVSGTLLKYQFTRGTYATVERDRTGGIVEPHTLLAAPSAKSSDTVVRWADLS
jgi:hypothetical protein